MRLRLFTLALVLSGFAGAPAQAASDPIRDDVMLNLQRCSGITDNRTWLNCFYGAAQPIWSWNPTWPASPMTISSAQAT